MRRRQLRGGLHVALEVPELAQADAADVDDVGRQGDGRARVLAVRQLRAQRVGEAREVLVEGEEADQPRGRVGRRGRRLGVDLVGGLLVGGDGLGVEVADLEEVDWDSSVAQDGLVTLLLLCCAWVCVWREGGAACVCVCVMRVLVRLSHACTYLLSLRPVHWGYSSLLFS